MLYVTTRDPNDAYTANRALSENRCPEGGFFVPMRLPHFDESAIAALAEKSFSQNVADILNLLFGTQLDGWGVEFGVGRYPVKLVSLNSRTVVAESWHNPMYRFERLANGIEKAVRQSDQINQAPTDWLMIASRIATLFGIVGQLFQNGTLTKGQKLDISLAAGNFSAPMAAWYARAMGLPIGMIVCSCNENTALWNLFHKGQLQTGAVAGWTHTPDCDYALPDDLERLIFATLGREETERYCKACRFGEQYELESEQMNRLREGLYISVISDKRMASTIPNLYKTTGFVPSPKTALAYSGLMDYRAATGESRPALLLSEESPMFSLKFAAECMNITPAELKQILD